MKPRVLVIEDNLDHAITTVLLLRDLGHEVECALNGGSGLAAARTFRPDVVLLDVGLPDELGWDVARLLKREHPRLRIFAVTGRSAEEDRRRSLEAGCEAHLVKPVDAAAYEALLATPRPADNLRDALRRELGRDGGVGPQQ
ncbi:MAG TPA: response regulator [Burkholderiales bacterium]